MKDIFDFEVRYYVKRIVYWYDAKVIIEDNKLKIETIDDSSGILKTVKNATGEYNIDDIKEIKQSSIWIIAYMHLFAWIAGLMVVSGVMIEFAAFDIYQFFNLLFGFGIIVLVCSIFSRVRTVKIIFKDNVKIHIPVDMLFFKSVDYKKQVEKFIETVKKRVSK